MNIYFKSVPFSKNDVTLALESGVDGVIVPADKVDSVSALSRIPVIAEEDMPSCAMTVKADEEQIRDTLRSGRQVVLARGWEVIRSKKPCLPRAFFSAACRASWCCPKPSAISRKSCPAAR